MCVCVDCACPTGDWPPCDRPVLTEPARVPLLARCRTGAAAAGHLHSHALLPWDALVLPRRLDSGHVEGGRAGRSPCCSPERVSGIAGDRCGAVVRPLGARGRNPSRN